MGMGTELTFRKVMLHIPHSGESLTRLTFAALDYEHFDVACLLLIVVHAHLLVPAYSGDMPPEQIWQASSEFARDHTAVLVQVVELFFEHSLMEKEPLRKAVNLFESHSEYCVAQLLKTVRRETEPGPGEFREPLKVDTLIRKYLEAN